MLSKILCASILCTVTLAAQVPVITPRPAGPTKPIKRLPLPPAVHPATMLVIENAVILVLEIADAQAR